MVTADEQKVIQKQIAASVNLIKQAEELLTKNQGSETASHRATALLLSAIARLLALQAGKEADMTSQTLF
jgi:hypothetical protein